MNRKRLTMLIWSLFAVSLGLHALFSRMMALARMHQVSKAAVLMLLVLNVLVILSAFVLIRLRYALIPKKQRKVGREVAAKAFAKEQSPEDQSLIRIYRFVDNFILCAVVAGGAIAIMGFDLPYRLSRHICTIGLETRHFVVGSGAMIVAILALMPGAVWISYGLLPRLTLKGACLWKEYQTIRSGSEKSRRQLVWISGSISASCLLAFILLLGNYLRVTDVGIYIRSCLCSSERFYSWAMVSEVENHQSRNSKTGKIVDHFAVRFSDGRVWSPRSDEKSTMDRFKTAVDFIAQRTNKEVRAIAP